MIALLKRARASGIDQDSLDEVQDADALIALLVEAGANTASAEAELRQELEGLPQSHELREWLLEKGVLPESVDWVAKEGKKSLGPYGEHQALLERVRDEVQLVDARVQEAAEAKARAEAEAHAAGGSASGRQCGGSDAACRNRCESGRLTGEEEEKEETVKPLFL